MLGNQEIKGRGRTAKELAEIASLKRAMRDEAERGKNLLARDPHISRADAIRYSELKGTHERSILGIITSKTGISFPRVKDESGRVLEVGEVWSRGGPFLLSKQLESPKWRVYILDHEVLPDGQVDPAFRIKIEPRAGERSPNPADSILVSYFGDGLEIRHGENVNYNDRFSYADYPFGQICEAITVAFTPIESEGDRRHREFMERAKRPE